MMSTNVREYIWGCGVVGDPNTGTVSIDLSIEMAKTYARALIETVKTLAGVDYRRTAEAATIAAEIMDVTNRMEEVLNDTISNR